MNELIAFFGGLMGMKMANLPNGIQVIATRLHKGSDMICLMHGLVKACSKDVDVDVAFTTHAPV